MSLLFNIVLKVLATAVSTRDVMYNMINIVNTDVCCILKSLKGLPWWHSG